MTEHHTCLIMILLIACTYQQVHYIDNGNGRDHSKNCIHKESPCKTPSYVINQYKPRDGVLSMEFDNGSFELEEVDIHCQTGDSPYNTLELFSKNQLSTKLSMHSVRIENCIMDIHSIQFQMDNPTAAHLRRITIINSNVNFTGVNFINIPHQMDLINSNLTMTNINYSGDDEKKASKQMSNGPLIHAVSNMRRHHKNFVHLKNWNVTFVQNPLILAYDCMVEIEHISVSNHNSLKTPPNSNSLVYPATTAVVLHHRPIYFISLHNNRKAILNNISISKSIFFLTIIRFENDVATTSYNDDASSSINQLSIIDCDTEGQQQPGVIVGSSVIEIVGKMDIALDKIKVKNTRVNVLLNVSKETNLKCTRNIDFEAKMPIYCNSGFYVAQNSCLPCEPGSYQPNSNNNSQSTRCLACPPGTFAGSAGQVMCDDCQPGTYCKNEGCSKCLNCVVKFSTSKQKATSCTVVHPFVYIACTVAMAFILIPSLALASKQMRKKYKKKKLNTD